jgi:hypothetical protein
MKLRAFLFVFLLHGCASIDNTLPSVEFGVVGNKFPDTKFGTYTQWNEKYAVTASHVGRQHNTAYQSKEVDLQFVKIPSSIKPKWGNFIFGEPVTMKGYTVGEKPMLFSVSGYTVDYGLYYNKSRNYALIDSGIQSGMSGGPVYNSKNEIVGISIGYTVEEITTSKGRSIHSIVLPYSEIKKEWDKFMKIQTPDF